MNTATGSWRTEVAGETSAAPARKGARVARGARGARGGQVAQPGPDFVMLPVARQWGEHRVVPPAVKVFVGLFTGITAFAVTALIR